MYKNVSCKLREKNYLIIVFEEVEYVIFVSTQKLFKH